MTPIAKRRVRRTIQGCFCVLGIGAGLTLFIKAVPFLLQLWRGPLWWLAVAVGALAYVLIGALMARAARRRFGFRFEKQGTRQFSYVVMYMLVFGWPIRIAAWLIQWMVVKIVQPDRQPDKVA